MLAAQQQAALEKPFDLFKAIFENEDDSSSSEEASDSEEPPDGAKPHPASPAIAATLPDHQAGQSHQRNQSQMEMPAVAKAQQELMQTHQAQQGSTETRQAQSRSMQAQQGTTAEASQQHISEPPGVMLHQAAASMQAPLALHHSDQASRPSSGKRRKLNREEKEKSHKKKSKKEKDKKRSGADVA